MNDKSYELLNKYRDKKILTVLINRIWEYDIWGFDSVWNLATKFSKGCQDPSMAAWDEITTTFEWLLLIKV